MLGTQALNHRAFKGAMSYQPLTPPSQYQFGWAEEPEAPELDFLVKSDQFDKSLWQSIRQQIRERLHPEKLPPLQLTSRPVKVRDIWGQYNYKKRGVFSSAVLHFLAVSYTHLRAHETRHDLVC